LFNVTVCCKLQSGIWNCWWKSTKFTYICFWKLRFQKLFRSKLHAWNSLSYKKLKSCSEQIWTGIIYML